MIYVAKIILFYTYLFYNTELADCGKSESESHVSDMDKMILKEIISPCGFDPNLLSKKFKVHTYTFARRRKRLRKRIVREGTYCFS